MVCFQGTRAAPRASHAARSGLRCLGARAGFWTQGPVLESILERRRQSASCRLAIARIYDGKGVTAAVPGSVEDLQLTVFDIDKARDELVGRGVAVSDVFHDAGGVFHHAGTEGRVAGPAPEHADYGSFASFSDPDGNGWLLQEIKVRLPGRVSGVPTGYDGASDLAEALRRAAAAHGEHEQRTGQEDPDWPDWYAEYMVRERAGEELPT